MGSPDITPATKQWTPITPTDEGIAPISVAVCKPFAGESDLLILSRRECAQKAWSLTDDQVDIWHIPFNHCFIDAKTLSPDEMLRADGYKFEVHRNQFMVYRCALRQILSLYYNKSPKDLMFSYSEHGKPYVLIDSFQLQFNLSHSDEMAVLGVTKYSLIGMDIEHIKPFNEMQSIAKQFFAETEFCKFISLPEKDKLDAFYNIWTRKEAFVKAVGEGLSYPLDKLTITFCKDDPPKIVDIDHSETEAMKWTLKSFNLEVKGKSYKVACLLKRKSCDVSRYMLNVD
jgi:4'-phosphopantetheinyl transferase